MIGAEAKNFWMLKLEFDLRIHSPGKTPQDNERNNAWRSVEGDMLPS